MTEKELPIFGDSKVGEFEFWKSLGRLLKFRNKGYGRG